MIRPSPPLHGTATRFQPSVPNRIPDSLRLQGAVLGGGQSGTGFDEDDDEPTSESRKKCGGGG